MIGYNKSIKIYDESDNHVVLHQHDWVTKENTTKFLNSKTGKTIFSKKLGAYTKVFVLEKQKLIVLLSNIKLDNENQFIVLNFEGKILSQKSIKCSQWKIKSHCSESVTNHVFWFHESMRSVEIKGNAGKYIIHLIAPDLKPFAMKL